jgi:hypothetical protein
VEPPDVKRSHRPLCFILMPFGTKIDVSGEPVDFDGFYRDVIRPAVNLAGMDPIRADEERMGGIIHKPMLERLVLCPFAIADLTLANANVFYEMGIRHAVRPHTTVLLYRQGGERLPFDVAPLRAIPYSAGPDGDVLAVEELRATIAERLDEARDPTPDSPLYQLLQGMGRPDVARLGADVFRQQVAYNEAVKVQLSAATASKSRDAVASVHQRLRPLVDQDEAVAVDLMLAYRQVGDHEAMVAVVGEMARPVAGSIFVREQLAWAENQLGNSDAAEKILQGVLADAGSNGETLGLLGRVYKDRWERSRTEKSLAAEGLLRRAIDAYRRGYESDWRDPYPGVNAVTLMEIEKPGDVSVAQLVSVVQYAAQRRLASDGDYWDRATLLELAVIAREDDGSVRALLSDALAAGPAAWMTRSTAKNLSLICEARDAAGEDTADLRTLLDELLRGQS